MNKNFFVVKNFNKLNFQLYLLLLSFDEKKLLRHFFDMGDGGKSFNPPNAEIINIDLMKALSKICVVCFKIRNIGVNYVQNCPAKILRSAIKMRKP
jgi:hypothetical protein